LLVVLQASLVLASSSPVSAVVVAAAAAAFVEFYLSCHPYDLAVPRTS